MSLKKIPAHELNEVISNSVTHLEKLRKSNIFITGATGFFGKWLVQVLVEANLIFKLDLHITIITRNKEKAIEDQPWLINSFITVINGDIKDFSIIDQNFNFIIHGATEASASLNDENPELMSNTIIKGTQRVLHQAAKSTRPKFLFISSGAVYGAQRPEIPHMPEFSDYGPDITKTTNAYSESKRMAELFCQFAQKRGEIYLSIARCYAFLGPYLPLDTHFAAGNFIRDHLEHKMINISGDGSPYRSYMYPTDLVEWLLAILVNSSDGQAYNVGSDEEIQLIDLARIIDKGSYGVHVKNAPIPDAKRNAYVPSVNKARNELGLKIRIKIQEAITRTLNWYKDD